MPEAEVDKLKAQAATATRQAIAPAASETAKFSRYLTVPSGVGMWNFLALTFCLMVGTAGLPHILTRYYTTPSVRQARTSVAWSLFFIFLLYFTAPAYAAFARFTIYAKLVGTKIAELPRWVTLWQPAGLFSVVDKNGDGVVQWADFVIRSTDFVVLSMPEIAGLPFVITGLVMAGGLAAALSTADGLLLTIANAISHDLYYNVINPRTSLAVRLTITKILLVVTAAHLGLRRDVPRWRSSWSWWPGPSAWRAPPSSRPWSWGSGGSGRTRPGRAGAWRSASRSPRTT